LYVEWNEEASSEPPGWYRCQVVEYFPDGLAKLRYSDAATEIVDLHAIKWHLTRRSSKVFLPRESQPPHYPLTKVREQIPRQKFALSYEHKVKAYADDLTVISQSAADHQLTLTDIDNKCQDIGLQIRPDKCVSIVLQGKKVLNRTFVLHNNNTTKSIKDAPSKFLGQTIASSNSAARLISSKRLSKDLTDSMERLDAIPIRGDYKIWIYRYYVIPAIFFQLAVNNIPPTTISKIGCVSLDALLFLSSFTQMC